MITRRGGNSIRIPITKTVDKGLTVQKHMTESILPFLHLH